MSLKQILSRHEPGDEPEAEDLARIRAFVDLHPQPFDRAIAQGHLTASALVLTADGARVLLLFHAKLRRWLQPGGHAEPGETQGEAIALREALEEHRPARPRAARSARRGRSTWTSTTSPRARRSPRTSTWTWRYLVVADPAAAIQPAEGETTNVRWFAWDELSGLDLDHGLRRALTKARYWCGRGGQ